jgi:hypothetical protein
VVDTHLTVVIAFFLHVARVFHTVNNAAGFHWHANSPPASLGPHPW